MDRARAAKQPRDEALEGAGRISRRRFMGYVLAAPTLVVAADLYAAQPASATLPTVQAVDLFDLNDLLTTAAATTSSLITVTVNGDGTASFALPRAEVGQGITTAAAMVIADEMDIALDDVKMTLADADLSLQFNQFTGSSNSMHALYAQLRVAASVARGQLTRAAAKALDTPLPQLKVKNGVIYAPSGKSASFGSLTYSAAAKRTRRVMTELKPRSALQIVGTPQRRIDALDAITGVKVFAMDLVVPGALPTMLCRPPTINGSARAILNEAAVRAMPGVTDVVLVPHTQFVAGGVAVRAQTFGQCIDAVRALQVQWAPGTADGKSDANVLADLEAAELPLTPALGPSIDQRFTFYFRPGDPLETNCAIADVSGGHAEIWSSLKSPVWAQQTLSTILGLPQTAVTVHVTQGGGSFGRHLFADAAFEAAVISQAIGKPVKLMWHRTDSFRQGRCHPMCTSRVRITYLGNQVLAFDQRHTSVATDFSMGLGEILTATVADLPLGGLGFSETVFSLTASVAYNFGVATQLLNEIYQPPGSVVNTSSVRNVYNPEVTTATELMVDQLAKVLGQDPYQLRRTFVRDSGMLTVLDKAAQAANWGQAMPAGTAQGIAIHREYKGYTACVAEIDCRPQTVNRVVPSAYTGPRVTRLTFVVDVGLPLNPLGLQAQMMGGCMDGIAQALSYSLHLENGYFLEGSWDQAHYTRQWNTPPEVNVIVMPASSDSPGGAGEFGVAASMAATACAYARATGNLPTYFPINHFDLDFNPLPGVPPIPESPTDGLTHSGPTVPGSA
jgi:isoquinoline 1-oxidoreductase beta subunit